MLFRRFHYLICSVVHHLETVEQDSYPYLEHPVTLLQLQESKGYIQRWVGVPEMPSRPAFLDRAFAFQVAAFYPQQFCAPVSQEFPLLSSTNCFGIPLT